MFFLYTDELQVGHASLVDKRGVCLKHLLDGVDVVINGAPEVPKIDDENVVGFFHVCSFLCLQKVFLIWF